MKHNVFLIALLVWSVQGFSQSLNLHIAPVFGRQPITQDTWFVSSTGDSIQFETIRFYLSAIQFDLNNGQTVSDALPVHLIDIFEPSTLIISLQNIDYKDIKTIRFNIGIDSTTSVSGALGGDLDPQKGMYWAWQSGYINMKIEGKSPQCKNRKNIFQYHIGGYMQPFYAMRSLELPINTKNTVEERNPDTFGKGIKLNVDLSKFFQKVKIASQNSIMIPSKEAVQLADLSIHMFSIDGHEK